MGSAAAKPKPSDASGNYALLTYFISSRFSPYFFSFFGLLFLSLLIIVTRVLRSDDHFRGGRRHSFRNSHGQR